ncbi:DMT family transporter [Inhella proteolytica]|uniref:DMT family transporter n=1 Tax=Inhella proteolytica TaxID=2795029 RepID=A0A931IXJ1_9BURK|nr:DMT family transporter [Inhella proteolytica]MBH9575559.1 DMT family transporter [Inhella proteolytica]
MRLKDLAELLLLAAIWGASFLFMRLAGPEFGALSLAFVRVAGAALFLLPLLAWRQGLGVWRGHARALLAVGFLNSALPFALYAFAALHLPAGLSSILNATTPMWGALVAWVWLAQAPGAWRSLGLLIGFAGVVWLAAERTGLNLDASLGAVLACLLATLNYALGAVATKRWLPGVPPLAVAAGSQLAAALWLLPFGLWAWPAQGPSLAAWGHLAALALLCTGVAYILYFRLMARVGPTQAITVTFLIPVFAVLWGALFLAEALTLGMLGGGLLVLAGTALALGLWPRPT